MPKPRVYNWSVASRSTHISLTYLRANSQTAASEAMLTRRAPKRECPGDRNQITAHDLANNRAATLWGVLNQRNSNLELIDSSLITQQFKQHVINARRGTATHSHQAASHTRMKFALSNQQNTHLEDKHDTAG